MNTNISPTVIVVFLFGVLGIPFVTVLVERLTILSGQRREVARVTRLASILLGWIIVAIVILTSIGFQFTALIQAVLVIVGAICAILLIYGFGKDILIGLMLVSDNDLHEGIKVEVGNSMHLMGHIREIGIIRTKVAGEDGRVYVLPNRIFQNAVFSIVPTRSTD